MKELTRKEMNEVIKSGLVKVVDYGDEYIYLKDDLFGLQSCCKAYSPHWYRMLFVDYTEGGQSLEYFAGKNHLNIDEAEVILEIGSQINEMEVTR